MIEVEGTAYDFAAAWEELGRDAEDGVKWKQKNILEELQEFATDQAPYLAQATEDYPYDPDSPRAFWGRANPTAFMNFAYQAGQGYPFVAYARATSSQGEHDPRLDTENRIIPQADHDYRQKVNKAALSFLRSKAGIPMWALGAGAAALALILFRR